MRYHFSEHGLFYASALVVALFVGALVIFAPSHAKKAAEAGTWPEVDAVILSSELSEVDTSDDTHFSTRIIADLKLRFSTDGRTREVRKVVNWTRRDHRNWDDILSPGRQVRVRVSPDDSSKVSLIDLIGVP